MQAQLLEPMHVAVKWRDVAGHSSTEVAASDMVANLSLDTLMLLYEVSTTIVRPIQVCCDAAYGHLPCGLPNDIS